MGAVAPRVAEPTAVPADGNVAAVSRTQYVPMLTAAVSKKGLVTLTFDLESGVRVTCDVGYLCANFVSSLASVLNLYLMYATDRQTSDKSIA